MHEFLTTSVFFGVFITLSTYGLGMLLKRKFKLAIFNPLLIAVVLTIVVLVAFRIDYDVYNAGANYINYLLTPATICLAIPLYEQFELLKHNARAVLAGILTGALTSLVCILVLALIFHFNHAEYVTFLPKSITTAIGMGVSEELGGYVSITVAVIVITGLIGNLFAEVICRVFRITEPMAQGVAIGTSSHAMGTAKAMELGEVQGAMSSLSIVVAGVFTVVGAAVFQYFL